MTTSVTMPIHTRNVLAAAAEALFILCDVCRCASWSACSGLRATAAELGRGL
jgi:hypothetical protein